MKNFAYLLFLTVLIAVAAQEGAPEAPPADEQPRVELDQDAIEAIMRNVSPGCRTEIEGAMETKTDVSGDCQEEIQGAIQSLNIKPKTTRPKRSRKAKSADGSGDDSSADAEREERKQRRAKKAKSAEPMVHPAFTLVAYLALFFGAGYAFFKYSLADGDDSTAKKGAAPAGGKKGKKNK
jgi:hypothetical protein